MPEMKISFLGTGSGMSIYRAHTAIALACPDGTRLLLDASSGNSVLRNGAELGMAAEGFDHVLLSHHHPDHMSGLVFLQFQRSMALEDESPLLVYSTEEALDGLRRHCLNTRLTSPTSLATRAAIHRAARCCAGRRQKQDGPSKWDRRRLLGPSP